MNARDRRTLCRKMQRQNEAMGISPMLEDMRSMTFAAARVVRNSTEQNLWIRRKVQEDKRPKRQARPGYGAPPTSRRWSHLMARLKVLQSKRSHVGDRVIKDGTHVEYTRRNGTVVTGWTTACEPDGVVTDEGLVLVEGPAYRLKLTQESRERVGHPITVAGSRLRVLPHARYLAYWPDVDGGCIDNCGFLMPVKDFAEDGDDLKHYTKPLPTELPVGVPDGIEGGVFLRVPCPPGEGFTYDELAAAAARYGATP